MKRNMSEEEKQKRTKVREFLKQNPKKGENLFPEF